MVVVIRSVVRRCTVAEVRMRNETELFEQLKRPVDGRDVDPARRGTNAVSDLVWSCMAERSDGFKDKLPLRRQPITPRPQVLMPRTSSALTDHAYTVATNGSARETSGSRRSRGCRRSVCDRWYPIGRRH